MYVCSVSSVKRIKNYYGNFGLIKAAFQIGSVPLL